MTSARNLSIFAPQVSQQGTLSYNNLVDKPQVISLKGTSITYPGNDLAADPAGGQTITITGTGFEATPTVYVGGVVASSVSFVSSTQITFTSPARSAGTYDVYIVNPGGATAIMVFGISYSGLPTWTTPAGSLGEVDGTFSVQLQATSNSAVSYSLANGSTLPSGVTLSSSGLLTGTNLTTEQTFSFSVVATDLENQDTPRSFQVTVALGDPFFRFNTLLLTGNGTNAAQNNTFLDSSTNNFTITRNGNTTQGTFTPYGPNWSNYFDGSGDFLTAPSNTAFDFGTGNFTIEAWGYRTSFGNYGFIISRRAADANYGPFSLGLDGSNVPYFSCSSSGSSWIFVLTGSALPLNTWFHLAGVRNGNTFTLYVNGVSVGTASSSASLMASSVAACIGAHANGSEPFAGYISNARIVKGTAVYTANFTPSTTPLTAITNTSLLTCADNRFIDDSTNNFTITRNGDVSVQRFSPFNPTTPYAAGTIGGSGYFDGTGDYLVKTGTESLSGNFTIEYWMYPTSTGSFPTTFSNYPVSPIGTILLAQFNGTSSNFYFDIANGTSEVVVGQYAVAINSWQHHAIVRSGSTITTYVNGVALASVTNSVNFPFSTVGIGGYTNGSYNFVGYISGFRVVNGSAVYTANFTPPTTPPTAITNTTLLLNFTNGGIIDNAMMNDLETVGNAQISTSVSKFGGGSLAFDGSGDALALPANINLAMGSGDFTVEMWVNGANNGSVVGGSFPRLFTLGTAQTSGCIECYNAAGTMYIEIFGVSSITFTASTLLNSTWNHYAITRSGTSLRAFVNGTQVGTTATNSTNLSLAATTQSWIGAIGASAGNFNGYIDDLRITKGYARYTANFTPPTNAHRLR